MPIKSLQSLLKNLLKRLQKPQQNDADIPSEDYGINLIEASRVHNKLNLTDRYQIRVNNSLVIVGFVVLGIYLLLAITNLVLSSVLDNRLKTQNELMSQIEPYSKTDAAAKQTANKIEVYRQLENSREKLSDKATTVFSNLDISDNLFYATVTHKDFSLSLEIGKTVDFAHLINKYMESNLISEVSIMSAEYDSRKQLYKVELKGVFR